MKLIDVTILSCVRNYIVHIILYIMLYNQEALALVHLRLYLVVRNQKALALDRTIYYDQLLVE